MSPVATLPVSCFTPFGAWIKPDRLRATTPDSLFALYNHQHETANLWWVQYYNSQDVLILNTLEVVDLPEVVRAAQQDIDDSRERLSEILQWIAC